MRVRRLNAETAEQDMLQLLEKLSEGRIDAAGRWMSRSTVVAKESRGFVCGCKTAADGQKPEPCVRRRNHVG